LCIKNNVRLIEIKQAGEKRSLSEIKDDLYKECQRLNIKLPENYNDITLDANKAFVKNENDILNTIKEIAKNKGGKCLSNEFKNVTTKLKWECKNGHQWESMPARNLSGCWCKSCAATERNLRRYSKQ
jgi:hypothetical protein